MFDGSMDGLDGVLLLSAVEEIGWTSEELSGEGAAGSWDDVVSVIWVMIGGNTNWDSG